MNADERPYSTRLSDYSEKNLKKLPGLEKKQYWYQFASLNNLFQDKKEKRYERIRQRTEWCMRFFIENPSIEQIAQGFPLSYQGLTGLVDSSLRAVNNLQRPLSGEFDPTLDRYIDRIRESYDKLAVEYDSEDFEIPGLPKIPYSQKITYRIPHPLSFAQVGLDKYVPSKNPIGRCEEHTLLTVYFLTIGHMIQDMPFGHLRDDIFYTAVAEPDHAFVILVKGSEFKLAIQKAREAIKIGEDNIVSWLIKHTETWGENAWIVDGWRGRSKLLKDYDKKLYYYMNERTIVRNTVWLYREHLQSIAEDIGLDSDTFEQLISALKPPFLVKYPWLKPHPTLVPKDLILQPPPNKLESFFEHQEFSTEWDVTVRRMIKQIESKSS